MNTKNAILSLLCLNLLIPFHGVWGSTTPNANAMKAEENLKRSRSPSPENSEKLNVPKHRKLDDENLPPSQPTQAVENHLLVQQPSLQELEKMARQGNADAQYKLGFRYWTGKGVPKSYRLAIECYGLAVRQGDLSSSQNLSVIEREITSIICSKQAILHPLDKSLLAEYYYNLGTLCQNGWGVTQNYPEAFQWYIQAVKNNKRHRDAP